MKINFKVNNLIMNRYFLGKSDSKYFLIIKTQKDFYSLYRLFIPLVCSIDTINETHILITNIFTI
jgi:hypothetical protein